MDGIISRAPNLDAIDTGQPVNKQLSVVEYPLHCQAIETAFQYPRQMHIETSSERMELMKSVYANMGETSEADLGHSW